MRLIDWLCRKKQPPVVQESGMRVYTFQAYGPALLSDDKLDIPSGPRIGWNDVVPDHGYWKVGDRIYSTNPLNPSEAWICTVEGSPGTWIISGSGAPAVADFVIEACGQVNGVGGPSYLSQKGFGTLTLGSVGGGDPGRFYIQLDHTPTYPNRIVVHVNHLNIYADFALLAGSYEQANNRVIVYAWGTGGLSTDQQFNITVISYAT